MSKLMYKNKPIGGTANNAGQIELYPISNMTSTNAQDAFSELNTNISNVDTKIDNKQPTLVQVTLLASSWSGGVYSFESNYPNATYNLEQIQPYGTVDQIKAWGKAMVVGNPSGNTIIARGTVPAIDIPVMMYVRRK